MIALVAVAGLGLLDGCSNGAKPLPSDQVIVEVKQGPVKGAVVAPKSHAPRATR
jgi:hypothetical protein